MPSDPINVSENASTVGSVTEVATVARASVDLITTTTADPLAGTGNVALAVTDRTFTGRYPVTSGNFMVEVMGTSGISERMLVTAGLGAGAGTFTVTRAQQGTAAIAHSVGAKVSVVERVQRMEPVDASREVTCKMWVVSFRTPGRAGTAGQKVLAVHNTGPGIVDVHKVTCDLVATVVKAVTVLPPTVRLYRFTAVPTNGNSLTKNLEDTSLTSRTAVTAWGDASADGTASVTTLTIPAITLGTQTGLIGQEFASRFMGGAGTNPQTEPADRMSFLEGEDEFVTLRASEGLALFLDYSLATQNPTTDMWSAAMRCQEYVPA